ncbi:MAG: T9SS type A sorting domain-containing protein, partial [Bacteroidota bacterium]
LCFTDTVYKNSYMKNTLLLFLFSFFIALGSQAQMTADNDSRVSQLPKTSKRKASVKIFPNPASDFIALQGEDHDVYEIRVISLVGKEVLKYEVMKGKKYSIMDIANGMYLVQMLDVNKKIITTQRLHKR